MLPRHVADLSDGVHGIHIAATAVVRVFQTHEARRGVMHVVPMPDGTGHLGCRDDATLAVNQVHLHA